VRPRLEGATGRDGHPRYARPVPWLEPDQLLKIPAERLGVLILHRLAESSANYLSLGNFTNEYLHEVMPVQPLVTSVYSGQDLRQGKPKVVAKISEAWTWLEHERYLGPDLTQRSGSEFRTITERGRTILAEPPDEALARIRAGHLLGEGLHPRIESQARGAWNDGNFGGAIFGAAREIEIAVGEALGPQPKKLYGVDVINAAFGCGKPLADADQDPGEQEGTRALYAGFLATFKNPGSHRHFEPEDPIQAAEIIRTADLLMRMLDDRLRDISAGEAGS
jgi:uncharacterized protein (TIGR02391 family)